MPHPYLGFGLSWSFVSHPQVAVPLGSLPVYMQTPLPTLPHFVHLPFNQSALATPWAQMCIPAGQPPSGGWTGQTISGSWVPRAGGLEAEVWVLWGHISMAPCPVGRDKAGGPEQGLEITEPAAGPVAGLKGRMVCSVAAGAERETRALQQPETAHLASCRSRRAGGRG